MLDSIIIAIVSFIILTPIVLVIRGWYLRKREKWLNAYYNRYNR